MIRIKSNNPAFDLGFMHECRMQGFTKKQASVLLDWVIQAEQSVNLTKSASAIPPFPQNPETNPLFFLKWASEAKNRYAWCNGGPFQKQADVMEWLGSVAGKVHNFINKGQEAAYNAGKKAYDVWDNTKTSVGNWYDRQAKKVSDTWDATKQTANNAWNATTQTASDWYDATKQTADKYVGQPMSRAWDATTQTASDMWDATKQTANTAWNATANTASDWWDATKQTADDAYEWSAKVIGNPNSAIKGYEQQRQNYKTRW